MPVITFSGSVLEKVDRVAAAATLHFSCEMTASVAKHLEWGELPEGSKKSAMDGQLAGGSFVLSPQAGKQAKLEGMTPDELRANVLTCGGFVVTRQQLEGSKNKGVKRKVTFALKSADADAAAKAEAWITSSSDTKASLRVDYASKEAVKSAEEDEKGEEE